MMPLDPSPAYQTAQNALVSLYREIRQHPEHKRLNQKVIEAICQEMDERRHPTPGATARLEALDAVAKAAQREQLEFIDREYGERLNKACADFITAGGDPMASILR